jgi:hypothetical protein
LSIWLVQKSPSKQPQQVIVLQKVMLLTNRLLLLVTLSAHWLISLRVKLNLELTYLIVTRISRVCFNKLLEVTHPQSWFALFVLVTAITKKL